MFTLHLSGLFECAACTDLFRRHSKLPEMLEDEQRSAIVFNSLDAYIVFHDFPLCLPAEGITIISRRPKSPGHPFTYESSDGSRACLLCRRTLVAGEKCVCQSPSPVPTPPPGKTTPEPHLVAAEVYAKLGRTRSTDRVVEQLFGAVRGLPHHKRVPAGPLTFLRNRLRVVHDVKGEQDRFVEAGGQGTLLLHQHLAKYVRSFPDAPVPEGAADRQAGREVSP